MTGNKLRKLAAKGATVYTATMPGTKFTPGHTQHFETEDQRAKFLLQMLTHGEHAEKLGEVMAIDCLSLLKNDYLA